MSRAEQHTEHGAGQRARQHAKQRPQRGGFVMGLVAGLLIGLALALGVALYITKAPIPFVNKVPQRTAEQDSAEAERNRTWDPNAPLGGKSARAPAAAAVASAATTSGGPVGEAPAPLPPGIVAVQPAPPLAPASSSARRDPAAILSGAAPQQPADPLSRSDGADPFIYFVQAGAFTRSEDAEQQRARLALVGQAARISEREQAGRTMYRVRLGPFSTRDAADGLQGRLQEQGIEVQIVRVERP